MGYCTGEWVHYETLPIGGWIRELNRASVREALSVDEGEHLQESRIYLYDDTRHPMSSDRNWQDYCDRLRKLAPMQIAQTETTKAERNANIKRRIEQESKNNKPE